MTHGRCICCGDWFKVRRGDGMIRVHGTIRGGLCSGSDLPPRADW